jgi:hypothetical protein
VAEGAAADVHDVGIVRFDWSRVRAWLRKVCPCAVALAVAYVREHLVGAVEVEAGHPVAVGVIGEPMPPASGDVEVSTELVSVSVSLVTVPAELTSGRE